MGGFQTFATYAKLGFSYDKADVRLRATFSTAANGSKESILLKNSLLHLQISGMWETVLRRSDCAL